MLEALLLGAIFWVGYISGYVMGKNAGYREGWKAKEYGEPYKPPF